MKDFKVKEYFMLSLKKNRNKENLHEINERIRPKKAVYFSFINNEIFNYRDKITIEQKICLFLRRRRWASFLVMKSDQHN